MQPSTSSSWNLTTTNGNFWSNGGFRKRKVAATDLEEHVNQKMFVTEEKMVKEMQTLSLELQALNNVQIETKPLEPMNNEIVEERKQEAHIEIHDLLKNTLKNDDLQDSFIAKICEMERKKMSMQLVPYIPVHPGPLITNSIVNNNENKDEVTVEQNQLLSTVVSPEPNFDDNIFKIPSVPTPYTVEEPGDNVCKRNSTMKRSFSQSDQYNSSLSVTELKSDGKDYSSIPTSQSAYFIVEPTSTPLCNTSSSNSSSSLSINGPSLRITEFNENSPLNSELSNTIDDYDDDIDMQSVASSDTGDKMDDD